MSPRISLDVAVRNGCLAVCIAGALWLRTAAAQPRLPLPIPPLPGVPAAVEEFVKGQTPLEGFFGAGELDPAALDRVEFTWEEEQRYGAAQFEALSRSLKQRRISLSSSGKDVQYVARLVESLRPLMRQRQRYEKLHVYVADSERIDAYTLAGGHVLVSRGMIANAGSEAALVCVLGHELSHLDQGHLVRQPKQVKLAEQSLKPGQGGLSFDTFLDKTRALSGVFRRPFGPAEELAADRDGITWAYKLGYDPRVLRDLFDRLAQNDNPALAFVPAFFRTHPPDAERKAQIAGIYHELQAAEPRGELYLGRRNLQRRLTREQQRFDE